MLHTQEITILHRNDGAALRLLCLPFAGGSATVYQFLSSVLPQGLLSHVELLAVDYPGHGARRGRETPESDFSTLVERLAKMISPLFTEGAVALLGCSMGALLGFEVARSLRASTGLLPSHLYVVSCGAPQFPIHSPDASDARALTAYLRGLGAAADEREISRRWIWHQAAYGIASTYRYREDLPPLACPITAFGGTRDSSIVWDELLGWQTQTTYRPFTYHLVDGEHLFLRQLDFLLPLTQHISLDLGLLSTLEMEDSYEHSA